jgi:hypothetical protein
MRWSSAAARRVRPRSFGDSILKSPASNCDDAEPGSLSGGGRLHFLKA